MPKRLNNIFYPKLKFKYMVDAYERAKKNKLNNKEILYQIISRSIKDKYFLNFTRKLIYSENSEKGIPIGNYTSQYFANIYLNELDYYVKEKLKIKYYVRYMDDFVMVLSDKQKCKEIKQLIMKFLKEKLDLELNDKTNYFLAKQGVNFCGYKIFADYIKLKKENKIKMYKKVKKWNEIYKEDSFNMPNVAQSLNSWIGHAQHANTYNLIKKVKKSCLWLYED